MIQTKEEEKKIKLETYTKYKDSGVEWLGMIPEGWKILPGLSFIVEGKEKNVGMKTNEVLSLSYGNIRVKRKEELTGLVPESFETYQLVNVGDLIFRPTDLQNDKVSLRSSISNFEGIITSAYLNLRFSDAAYAKFYHYLFRAIDNNKVIYGLGSGLRQNINYLDFRRFLFPFPPLPEQTAIANFLDDKTTKIDKAITQKEELIALLKERKQILIQQAVTKGLPPEERKKAGLDPIVKLKDSGIDWIGEIPKHWKITKLGYYIDLLSGFAFPSSGFKEEGVKLLRGINVGVDKVKWKENVYWPQDKIKGLNMYFLELGDIVVGMDRPLIGKGMRVAIVEDKDLPSLLLQRVTRLRGVKGLQQEYLSLILRSQDFIDYFLPILSGVSVPHISPSQIKAFPICLPSEIEQIYILEYLKRELGKLDLSISLQQTQIEKLREYKSVLIDNAVTGKIKIN